MSNSFTTSDNVFFPLTTRRDGVPTDLPNGVAGLSVQSLSVVRGGTIIDLDESLVVFAELTDRVADDGQYVATIVGFETVPGDTFIFSYAAEVMVGEPPIVSDNQLASVTTDLGGLPAQLEQLQADMTAVAVKIAQQPIAAPEGRFKPPSAFGLTDIVYEDEAFRDGCPVLGRTPAFISKEGVCATIDYVFKNTDGQPVSLEGLYPDIGENQSPPRVVARIREFSGFNGISERSVEVEALILNGAAGNVQFKLPESIACESGLYHVDLAYKDPDGEIVGVNQTLLSVEKSLFGAFGGIDRDGFMGTPTINEIRMRIMDYPGDNSLLDDVEFSNDQILFAIGHPIQEWESELPQITRRFTTKTFPYRERWSIATIGYLYRYAAAYYRRNYIKNTGGGITIEDRNKEQEYLIASNMMLQEWRIWMKTKKIQLNGEEFYGTIGGSYGGYY